MGVFKKFIFYTLCDREVADETFLEEYFKFAIANDFKVIDEDILVDEEYHCEG